MGALAAACFLLWHVVVASAVATTFDCSSPSDGYELYHGRYYKDAGPMSYEDSLAACEAEGTQLAIITDWYLYRHLNKKYGSSGAVYSVNCHACILDLTCMMYYSGEGKRMFINRWSPVDPSCTDASTCEFKWHDENNTRVNNSIYPKEKAFNTSILVLAPLDLSQCRRRLRMHVFVAGRIGN